MVKYYDTPYHMREYSRICDRCDKSFKGTKHSRVCDCCRMKSRYLKVKKRLFN